MQSALCLSRVMVNVKLKEALLVIIVKYCNKNTYRIHNNDPVLSFLSLVLTGLGFGILHLPAQAHFEDNSTVYENNKGQIVTNVP